MREEALSVMINKPCITDLYCDAIKGRAAHVDLTNRCATATIVPATTNVIGKLANSVFDDPVTTFLSVFIKRTILSPAVHPNVLRNKAVARNFTQLEHDGFIFCGPVQGHSLSEGRESTELGAMPDPAAVVAFLEYVKVHNEIPSYFTDR